MSVLAFAQGDKFIIRTFKSLGTSPMTKWSNSYEFEATESGEEGDLRAAAAALLGFEQQIHTTQVVFDYATISTWVPDSIPYNPEEFMVQNYGQQVGEYAPTTPAPLTICLFARRETRYGRAGKVFYRSALGLEELQYDGGVLALAGDAPIRMAWTVALSTSTITNYWEGAAPVQMRLIGYPKNATAFTVVPVEAMNIAGVSEVQLKHAWFNRNMTPQPG